MRLVQSVQFGIGTVLGVIGLVFVTAEPVSAEMVLCKSSFLSIVKAREGSCRRRETEIPFPQGPQGEKGEPGQDAVDTNAETICNSEQLLDGDGFCVDDPNACAANEVLLGAGGGCIPIANLIALGTPKTFFVTSAVFDGDLVSAAKAAFPIKCETVTLGLEAGDCICQAIADGAALVPAGIYKAWLSDQTGSPSTRFTQSLGPYNRVDGLPIASSYAGLVGGSDLLSTPNVDEAGAQVSHNAWTGTGPDGLHSGYDCESWTTFVGLPGDIGIPDRLDLSWTQDPDISPIFCAVPAGVYCFGR